MSYKAQAVLMSAAGLRPDAVGEVIPRKERTIILWLRDWNNRRLASLFSEHRDNGNAAKLTRSQKEQIKRVLASPPSDSGIPKDFWDVPSLKHYVSATFGVVYESDQSYYFMLKFSGLSFKYPDTFDRKRDETLVAERMERIRSEIKPLLHRDDWEVFAVDEVKMQQEAVVRKAWLRKNQRTVIKVDRDKQSQNYIGFLDQKTFDCHVYEMGWQNSREVLKAMERFLTAYPDKHIAIVWDNAPFHKSKQIKEELKRGGVMERVHIIAMPPYAPDENPIEHVWNSAKQKVANIQHDTFEDTKRAFSDYVASRRFHYSF